MTTIYDWNSLKKYGIQNLTGESCAYSLRVLCDVNQEGKELLETFFSVTLSSNNWNPSVNGKDSVASIMLPWGILTELAIYILFHVEHSFAVHIGKGSMGIQGLSEAEYGEYSQDPMFKDANFRLNWNYRRGQQQRDGRNIHQMSGRIS